MKAGTIIMVGSVCFYLALGTTQGKEVRLNMSDLPPAVQAAVKEQSKGATIRGLSKETEKGKTIYEVELTKNGHGKDVSMDTSGRVVEVEEEVALGSIPEAARNAIQKSAGSGKILKVEAVSAGSGAPDAYEAQVLKAGKRSEVRVAPDGSPKPEED
jgi:hypothetical protein